MSTHLRCQKFIIPRSKVVKAAKITFGKHVLINYLTKEKVWAHVDKKNLIDILKVSIYRKVTVCSVSIMLSQLHYTGCQDPWNLNRDLRLPACTNITHIRGSYGRGSDSRTWDEEMWNRPYNSEIGLANTEREGVTCKVPCNHVDHHASEPIYIDGKKENWR